MSVRRRKKADEDEPGDGEKKSEEEVDPLQPKSPPLSEPESDREQKKKAKCFSFRCLLIKLIIPTTLIVLFLWLVAPIAIEEYLIWRGYERAKDFGIPNDMMHLFSVFDGDSNGALDPYEFMFAVEEISRSKKNMLNVSALNETYNPVTFVDQHRGDDKEFVEIKVNFEPLVLSSMTKFKDPSSIFGTPTDLVPGLVSWKGPRVPVAEYGVGNFEPFVPPRGKGVGEPYYIVESSDGGMLSEMLVSQMSPYKYFPPVPKSNEVFLHVLMLQLHKYPFVHLRFGPRGTVGIVRAENDKYWDILIRAHVEFQLNDYPDLPFWFTPAQFAGRLIISKDNSHIVMFEMEVPNNRSLNIDMEWLTSTDGESNEVDIGFLPMMKLSSVGPSREEGTTDPLPPEPEPKWTSQIDAQEARTKLERFMYPFKEVKYHNFKEAFDLASEQQKPVHHILLWGALDDQSC